MRLIKQVQKIKVNMQIRRSEKFTELIIIQSALLNK